MLLTRFLNHRFRPAIKGACMIFPEDNLYEGTEVNTMMKLAFVLAFVVGAAYGQYKPEELQFVPVPYSFNYLSSTEDGGSSSRQESGDGSGVVRGSYTVENLEGHKRVVEYEAGPEGFKAIVRTNEPGTDSSSPAGVVFESTAADAKGPVIRYSNEEASRYNPPAPAVNTVNADGRQPNVRYVLVPSTDPRAAGRGQN